MNLLQMSFSGAAFITAVVIIRAVAINKLPKKTFLVLWELVILRLLIPFSIPSMFSVYTLVTHSISSTTLPEAGTDSHYARAVCYDTGSRTAAREYFIICFHVVYCMVCRNNTYRIVFCNILFALSD